MDSKPRSTDHKFFQLTYKGRKICRIFDNAKRGVKGRQIGMKKRPIA